MYQNELYNVNIQFLLHFHAKMIILMRFSEQELGFNGDFQEFWTSFLSAIMTCSVKCLATCSEYSVVLFSISRHNS